LKLDRRSGVLLHPTSLPGRHGIGELGQEARAFVDFLQGAKQAVWQVLPLGPTGYGDSPYQCFSAFAGNPLLVSLDALVEEGLLDAADLEGGPGGGGDVDYGRVIPWKLGVLRAAARHFDERADNAQKKALWEFCAGHADWLDDYALYRVLKDAHDGRSWTLWPAALRDRDQAALERVRKEKEAEIRAQQFWQWLFFRQWGALREYAHERGVRIMGDIPIFVSHDSSDVWAGKELFRLKADGVCEVVAGVPPDYFSATGQLWGNPLYRWDVMKDRGYRWWIDRFRATFAMVDLVRLDHFRGFHAYWEIPEGEPTAVNGRWVTGPGAALFEALRDALGDLPIVAENLGLITPEVEALREKFGFPGMAILEFAFGTDSQANAFLPHNFTRHRVVYTGTHDNDTIVGWWTAGVGDSTRTQEEVEKEHAFATDYLDAEGREIHWAFVRGALASIADLAIVPVQDLLGLGGEARMNLPGRAGGNWKWRLREGQLTDAVRDRLARLTTVYGRAAAV
jgi:4-alpha-glucanotransferase